MTTAAELFALQEIDLSLDRARQRLAEIEEALGETEELVQAREALEEKRGELAALKSRQADLEWAVEEVRGKASEIEAKLYGGSVRNPKELGDLHADMTSLQAQTRRREDDLLALLIEVDEAEAAVREAEMMFRELESAWKTEQAALLEEKGRLEPEVERLRGIRDERAPGIDRASLSLYGMLRERKAGVAVAKVERGMCQGCRITLPMSLLQRARAGLGLVQCVSCERILLVS